MLTLYSTSASSQACTKTTVSKYSLWMNWPGLVFWSCLLNSVCKDSTEHWGGGGQESHDLLVHKANFPNDLGFSSITNRRQRKFSKAELTYFEQFFKYTCTHTHKYTLRLLRVLLWKCIIKSEINWCLIRYSKFLSKRKYFLVRLLSKRKQSDEEIVTILIFYI